MYKKKYCFKALIVLFLISNQLVAQKSKLGWELIKQQNFSDALLEFDQSIELNPNDTSSYIGRARCYLMIGDYNSAEENITKVLVNQDKRADLLFLAGNIYFQVKEYNKAIEHYTGAIENNKPGKHFVSQLDLYYNRGNALLNMEKYNEARDDFIKAIIEGDKSADVHLKISEIFHEIGNKKGACDYYQKAIKLDSTSLNQIIYEYCSKTDTLNLGAITKPNDTTEIYDIVDVKPLPMDGMRGFYRYLGVNMRYPEDAIKRRIEGRVFVQFIVNRDGSLSDVRAIKGIGGSCDQEAVRIVKNAQTWYPAINKGELARTRMILPIEFNIK
ncbi:TonB family C-terminal domain-containing protein [Reichenbachiella agariperforans]|uniref:TonB family C-terminal domain-containing protein n=1 Tax=Reichenbachiella agariperforans TaxID=156994 RepID=A0A1M6QKD6_REIAG|nr:TonB family protein [Reichenbachiella agariperforans]SHK20570.1 TonB family C-terminal domain-containing protein [Reichenbachiella agariperforans]